MATIPIEIILQDAESPVTPTPESGGETNITVPDTGTISDGGSNSGGIGSSASIILPAIIAVFAIGVIVAMLVYKHHKHQNDKLSKKEKLATVASGAIAILAATVLVGNLVIPATKAATSDIEDGITPAEDKVSIVVTRDGGVAEANVESTATITSTSDFGYKVLLSMAEGAETSNLYLNGDEASGHYIAATESTELGDNTWGYALAEDGEYGAVPLLDNAVTVAQGNEPVEDESLSIYYGVKVSSDLPAGTYSGGEIEYTLESVPGFPDTLVYMQDMTPEICATAPTPGNSVTDPVPTATLIDSRDSKTYTIAKLADGNCWMTQNLDLDLKTDGTITYDSTNTNLPVSTTWVPERATIAKNDLSFDTWYNDGNNPYSYDPGDAYYYTSGSDADDIKYDSLEACVGANHTEAECKHYYAGNYYNWTAAIASNDGSGYTENYQHATTSICPAGWRLPLGPNTADDVYGEVGDLAKRYNNIFGPSREYYGSYIFPYLDNGFEELRVSPLWWGRFGQIDDARDGVLYSGMINSSWYGTAQGNTHAYTWSFGTGYLQPLAYQSRSYGFVVRCVAE